MTKIDREKDKNSEETGLKQTGAAAFPLRKTAGHLIRRAHQVTVSVFNEEVGGVLSPHQFGTLLSLCQEPGLHQIDLIERIAADRSTVSDVVKRLEQKGLLKKERLRQDERKTALFITDKGIKAVAKALPGSVHAHARVLSFIPEHLREPFLEALEYIAKADGKIGSQDD